MNSKQSKVETNIKRRDEQSVNRRMLNFLNVAAVGHEIQLGGEWKNSRDMCGHIFVFQSRWRHLSSQESFNWIRWGRKSVKKFRRYLISSNDEASIRVLYRLDVIVTTAVGSFVNMPGAIDGSVEADQDECIVISKRAGAKKSQTNYRRGGNILQDSTCKLKHLVPIDTTNLRNSSFRIIKIIKGLYHV